MVYAGELAALAAAMFWTVTAIAFEKAGKRIGSLQVNLLRLGLAFVIFGVLAILRTGHFFPHGAGTHQWLWLSISGIVGFVLGDLFLFQAYVVVGARISMLIMSLAPPIAALIGWLVLGETLSAKAFLAMMLTLVGISMVILVKSDTIKGDKRKGKRLVFRYPIIGLLLAFGGACGQAMGLVLSKYGMETYDVVSSTQIRVIAGTGGFMLIFALTNRWRKLNLAFSDKRAIGFLSLGAVFGPFLGVTASLIAVKYTGTGIASSIMSIVPVLIIPPAIVLLKERVRPMEIMGAGVAITGVVLFFL
ncbi:MAG TPA: DMT family transporter [Bacteroidales bacterium]|nr:DMT family transporter [Bacteroidales bacterium]